MKKSKSSAGQGRNYLLGAISLKRRPEQSGQSLQVHWLRFFGVVVSGILVTYLAAVLTAFIWLHHVRKVEEVTWLDVASLRWKRVRRDVAAHQYATALAEWKAQKLPAAYLAFTSALRNDPDNVALRLSAAEFLTAGGSSQTAAALLEDGLQRGSVNEALIEKAFESLSQSARDAHILKMLHGPLASRLADPKNIKLRMFEISATGEVQGMAQAAALVDKYSDVRTAPECAAVVSRVQWENKQRLAAIGTLSHAAAEKSKDYAVYAQLAAYEEAAGMSADARLTAKQACANLPDEIMARILLIGTFSPIRVDELQQWNKEIASFLHDFARRPGAINLLADLAGRKGWIDLTRELYEIGATRQLDVRLLAIYYCDALRANRLWSEAQRVLAQVEAQVSDPGLTILVRQREILTAWGNGDRDEVKELSRRLLSELQPDSDKVEIWRRQFARLGVEDAARELAATPLKRKSPLL